MQGVEASAYDPVRKLWTTEGTKKLQPYISIKSIHF